MNRLSRKILSLDDLIKKPLQGKKSITLNIKLFKKEAIKQNILTEVKLEVCHVPCSRNSSLL